MPVNVKFVTTLIFGGFALRLHRVVLPLHIDGVFRALARRGSPMKVDVVEHILSPETRKVEIFARNMKKAWHITDLRRVEPAVATEGTSLRGRSGWKTTVRPLLVISPLMSSK